MACNSLNQPLTKWDDPPSRWYPIDTLWSTNLLEKLDMLICICHLGMQTTTDFTNHWDFTSHWKTGKPKKKGFKRETYRAGAPNLSPPIFGYFWRWWFSDPVWWVPCFLVTWSSTQIYPKNSPWVTGGRRFGRFFPENPSEVSDGMAASGTYRIDAS